MLTRCPACQTVFRVSAEQLAARAGRVRCGHCLKAFNAAHNAVEERSPAQAPDAGQAEPQVRAAPAAAEAVSTPAREATALPPDGPGGALPAVFRTRAGRPDSLPEEGEAANAEEAASEVDTPAVEVPGEELQSCGEPQTAAPVRAEADPAETAAVGEAEAAGDAQDEQDPATREVPQQRHVPAASIPVPPPALASRETAGHHRVWGIALGALGMALLVQGLFLLRQPLTQAIPALREPLAALCQRLGCELPLPQEAAEISIEASDLHPEPGGQGDFVLHATLRNRAAYPQAYPHVELSLTDAGDRPVVRRVFTPAEWAPGGLAEGAFGAGAIAEVALPFNAAGVAGVGYRVYAFYP